MIISCTNCKKKFELEDNLIPDTGRLLQCSSCSHKWFFKKELLILPETSKKKIDPKNKKESFLKSEIPNEVERIIIDAENLNLNDDRELKKINKKILKKPSLFNLFIVILISFFAFVIFLDTFRSPIGDMFPGFNFMLDNFYETLKDLFLFFNDLIR